MFINVSNRFELMDGFTTKAGSYNRDRDGRRSISSFGVTTDQAATTAGHHEATQETELYGGIGAVNIN